MEAKWTNMLDLWYKQKEKTLNICSDLNAFLVLAVKKKQKKETFN